MKHIFTLPTLILITLSHNGCQTTKQSNRQQTRVSVREQSDTKTRVQEIHDYSRSEFLSDSSGHSYHLTIFPADTFHFSLQNGFIGKASKVVLTGSSQQVVQSIDTSKFTGSITSEVEEKVQTDSTETFKGRDVSVERKGMIGKGIGISLIAGLIMLGIWRKFIVGRSFL